jgi:triosephosphate isomerase
MVAGNWKMNGLPDSIEHLVSALNQFDLAGVAADVLVCPPSLFIERVQRLAEQPLMVGCQNVSEQAQGAFTGEVSADMLQSLGLQYCIVGHSERRAMYGDSDKLVAAKVQALQNVGITPIVCVGETLAQRETDQTITVVEQQLNALVEVPEINLAKIVIAYEPVWAIGTGKTASPEQAQAVHHAIRQWLQQQDAEIAKSTRVLYGGSVKASNAEELFAQPDIDGGLIGGAALDAEQFYGICRAAG